MMMMTTTMLLRVGTCGGYRRRENARIKMSFGSDFVLIFCYSQPKNGIGGFIGRFITTWVGDPSVIGIKCNITEEIRNVPNFDIYTTSDVLAILHM